MDEQNTATQANHPDDPTNPHGKCAKAFDAYYAERFEKGSQDSLFAASLWHCWQDAWNARSAGTHEDVRTAYESLHGYLEALHPGDKLTSNYIDRLLNHYLPRLKAALTAMGGVADPRHSSDEMRHSNDDNVPPPATSPAPAVGDDKLSAEEKKIIIGAMRDSADKTSKEIVEKVATILNPPQTDWLPHHGRECPVSGDTMVQVDFGRSDFAHGEARMYSWEFSGKPRHGNIVAYRIVKPGGEV